MAVAEQQGAPADAAVVPAPKVAGGPGFSPTAAQVQQFREDGVLVVRSLFSVEEAALIQKIGKATTPESVIWLSADTHKPDVQRGCARAPDRRDAEHAARGRGLPV